MMNSRSPLSWVGGKFYITKDIISLFPPHQSYVEVFGGAGHILFAKSPSPLEVYNDIDEDVVNFFKVLRDKPKELYERLEFVPYSRKLFCEWKEEFREGKFKDMDSVEWACRWFTLVKQSFSSNLENRNPHWGYSKQRSHLVNKFSFCKELLPRVAKRLLKVQIECLDFEKVLELYDTKDTLFYCDPPYIGVARYYNKIFSLKDHLRLAEILNNIKGKVILSYYPHRLLDDLYAGWNRKIVEVNIFSQPTLPEDKKRRKATELLLYNYKLKERQLNFLKC